MSFARKSLLVSIGQMVAIPLGVLGSVVLYRAMGPDGTGQFNLFRRVAVLVAAFAAFGCGNASIFYLRNKKIPPEQIVGTLLGYAAAASIPLGLFIVAGTLLAHDYFGNVRLWVAIVFGIGVAALLCFSLLRMVLIAQVAARQLVTTSLTPLAVMLVLGGTLALANLLTAERAVCLFAFSQVLTLALSLWYLRSHIRPGSFSLELLRRLFAYGSKLYLANVLLMMGSTGTLMLLRHNSTQDFAQVGLFSTAVGISAYVNMPLRSISPLLYAKWAGGKGLSRIVQVELVARTNMAFGVLVSLGTILMGRTLIDLLYGDQFAEAQAALIYMVPATAMLSFYAIFDSLLAGAGRAGVSAWIFGITTPVTLGLTALLVPTMGFVGAAVATLLGTTATAAAGVLVSARLIGVRPLHCLLIRRSDIRYLLRALRKRVPPKAEQVGPVVTEKTNGTTD